MTAARNRAEGQKLAVLLLADAERTQIIRRAEGPPLPRRRLPGRTLPGAFGAFVHLWPYGGFKKLETGLWGFTPD